MKKIQLKKLVVHKDTLRTLGPRELQVAGAQGHSNYGYTGCASCQGSCKHCR
jgi:hypothetical protein